ncbi:MAG: CPBP family glutamic-type intramembrane protease [Kofleriaceae bacterium]
MERRGVVPVEVAAVIVAAVVAAWDPPPLGAVSVMLPLLVIASALRWTCGKSFAAVTHARFVGIGALVGVTALAIAVVLGTPFAEALSDRPVVWAADPVVRGNPAALLTFAVVVAAVALATELVLRGWIVERVLELGGSAGMAIFAGALAEALVQPGPLEARIGAFAVGLGLGQMYVAAGRNVAVPIAARVAFGLGALVLEMLRAV